MLVNRTLRLEVDPGDRRDCQLALQGRSPVDLADREVTRWLEPLQLCGRPHGGYARTESRRRGSKCWSDRGLTASVAVYAQGAGCRQLITILRVIDGLDRVDIINVFDKEKVLDKESVHLGFPFQVPGGVMRVNTPWAVVGPKPTSCPVPARTT